MPAQQEVYDFFIKQRYAKQTNQDHSETTAF